MSCPRHSVASRKLSKEKSKNEENRKTGKNHTPTSGWTRKYCKRPGNEWLEEIDPDFLEDFTNFVGLEDEISHISQGYHVIMSNGLYLDSKGNKDVHSQNEERHLNAAETLYGLLHARYLLTSKGLSIVRQRYKEGKYGVCPRYCCAEERVLPIGHSDTFSVKIYCPSCKDIYHSPFDGLDGAYFGTSLPQMFFMTYPNLQAKADKRRHITNTLNSLKIHKIAHDEEGGAGEYAEKNEYKNHGRILVTNENSESTKENDATQNNEQTEELETRIKIDSIE